jgi:PhnB protein
MASANPYLNFSGNCLEAFEFYKSVLGGEFSSVNKFSEMPSDATSDQTHEPAPAPAPAPAPDGIMHISLPIGDSILMGSDVPPGMGTVTAGNTCYVCLSPDSPDEAKRVFDGLSEGGEIEMPFDRQFWGDYFGSFTDKYGIRWMVDVADPEVEQPAT